MICFCLPCATVFIPEIGSEQESILAFLECVKEYNGAIHPAACLQ